MDTGLADILGKPKQYAPNALVIFDLKTDQLIRRYTFPSSDVQSGTFFANVVCISSLHSLCLRVYVARVKAVKIFLLLFFSFRLQIVDVQKNDCENAHAYIPDLGAYGVVVYSFKNNKSWRATHNYFHFDPLNGDYNVGGVNFQWTDGVFGIGLGTQKDDGLVLFIFRFACLLIYCII